jgi:hypothetical protein
MTIEPKNARACGHVSCSRNREILDILDPAKGQRLTGLYRSMSRKPLARVQLSGFSFQLSIPPSFLPRQSGRIVLKFGEIVRANRRK